MKEIVKIGKLLLRQRQNQEAPRLKKKKPLKAALHRRRWCSWKVLWCRHLQRSPCTPARSSTGQWHFLTLRPWCHDKIALKYCVSAFRNNIFWLRYPKAWGGVNPEFNFKWPICRRQMRPSELLPFFFYPNVVAAYNSRARLDGDSL